MSAIRVTKRNGKVEELMLDKMHQMIFWATEGIMGVSASEVEIKSQIQFYDGITSEDIQEILIKSASNLITAETPNYQYVAGRLLSSHLRKQVYNAFDPCHIVDLVVKNIERGYYDPALIGYYSPAEWEKINSFVKHERDMEFAYISIEQLRSKYLVKNRVTGEIYETPQMAYILIAAVLFKDYPKESRLQWVRDYYEAISKQEISLPTPIMAGLRTTQKQFSSCTLIDVDDSLDSINAASSAIVKYVSQKAGIGLNVGKIRALGSPIRNGDVSHTGITPFIKLFNSAVSSCNQGGVRKGSATLNYIMWHLEVEDMLVLKNNKGVEENRVRTLDYCVQVNKVMYERLLSGGNITLFSPHEVPEMYDAYFTDVDKFRTLYEAAEKNKKLRKKVIPAVELFSKLMTERKDTGRIYISNVDNVNNHGSLLSIIKMTNLCVEITNHNVAMGTYVTEKHVIAAESLFDFISSLNEYTTITNLTPTEEQISNKLLPVETKEDLSEISLCTLSAVNWGKISTPKDFEKPCNLAVRALDSLLDYQDYPVSAAKRSTANYRYLGIGIINFAYWLAKNDLNYSSGNALDKVDEYMEAMSYYLIKASVDLAEEKGACLKSNDTKYAQGIFPIDTYKKDVDGLVSRELSMPWDQLKERAKKFGIRNATLMALMPADTSATVGNATNGIEPPRALVSIKQSKDGVLRQVVPEIKKLKNKYELLWDQPSPDGYLNICAVLQKYIDQAISVNVAINPANYPDGKIGMSDLLKQILTFYKFGGKNLYYHWTKDGSGEISVDKLVAADTESKAASVLDDDEDCVACKI
jgi:ribonucleoside-diphosphate reductase alpha chain